MIDKARQIAAHQLEVAADDLEFADGHVHRQGLSRQGEDAQGRRVGRRGPPTTCPTGMEPGLEATAVYDPPNFSWPGGAHAAVVEVDTETGDARLVRYVAIDDVGTVVNPIIVDGQVHGGITQGISTALYEEGRTTRTATSRRRTSVTVPRALRGRAPVVRARPHGEPEPDEPARGEGRGGDGHDRGGTRGDQRRARRLSHLGVKDIQMPATPERVWRAIQEAKA